MKNDVIKEFKADRDCIDEIRSKAIMYAETLNGYAILLGDLSERYCRLQNVFDHIGHDTERLLENFRILFEILDDC